MSQKQVIYKGPKRPVDKDNLCINGNVATTQTANTIRTASAAETLVRLVGSVLVASKAGGAQSSVAMAIVILRESVAASTLSYSSGSAIYEPVADVLWSKHVQLQSTTSAMVNFDIDIKAMRKLKKGDRIQFLYIGQHTSYLGISGDITSFYKQ